jgi:hypothetical protein
LLLVGHGILLLDRSKANMRRASGDAMARSALPFFHPIRLLSEIFTRGGAPLLCRLGANALFCRGLSCRHIDSVSEILTYGFSV